MSDTPRTDALCEKQGSRPIDHPREILELESLARELEMENAQIRDDNARLRDALENLVEENTIAGVAQARAALAQTEDK